MKIIKKKTWPEYEEKDFGQKEEIEKNGLLIIQLAGGRGA